MKRVLIVLVALFVCASVVSAETSPVAYAGGGIGMPLAPTMFSDFWKMGIGFGGGVGFSINPKAELIGRVAYSKNPLDTDKLLAGVTGVTIDGLDFTTLAFGVDLKYMFKSGPEAKGAFYLIGGGGMATAKFTDVTISGGGTSLTLPASEVSESKPYLNSAAGFDYMVSPQIGIWFEARLVMVLTSGESTALLPLGAGLKFAFGGN